VARIPHRAQRARLSSSLPLRHFPFKFHDGAHKVQRIPGRLQISSAQIDHSCLSRTLQQCLLFYNRFVPGCAVKSESQKSHGRCEERAGTRYELHTRADVINRSIDRSIGRIPYHASHHSQPAAAQLPMIIDAAV